MARRIVPELISPTQASAVHPAFEAAAEQAPNLRFNLKEQAELAKSLLEPGRKLYVDISQESKVNWRKLQLAAGVQKQRPQQKTTLAVPLDKASMPQMQRLEPDSDDSASEPEGRQANPGLGSALQEAHAGQRSPAAHSGHGSHVVCLAVNQGGESDASGQHSGHHSDYYENDDGFIDDTEVHEFFGGDWHKPKHSGFYINQGDIEKTDELLLSDDPDPESKRKRKLKPKQGQMGSPSQPGLRAEFREVMGKDGRMKKVRRKVKPVADGTPLAKKPKPNKEGVDGKTPKPARRPAQAAATDAAATAAPQGMPWSPDPAQRLPPWEASKPVSPQTAAPTSLAAAAPQPAPTPEEDKMSLAALAAGVTPAKAARDLTASLPTSPSAGLGPPLPAPAPVRTPLTGKKRPRDGTEGYEIPSDVKQLLDQLKAQAEALGLPQDGKAPSDDPSQPGEDKAPKKLPPQLNPLLAKLARAAARENELHPGARTVIANAAYSFLHPWSHKGNMAVRLKKLHESAQARYDKSKEGLVNAVAQQPPGLSQPKPKPIGYDDDFATLPGATPSQQAAPAVSASGEAASAAAAAAAGSNGLVWDKAQALALHNYVASLLDLQGGREDNPSMWQDVAAKSDLWGGCRPTASELKHVYDQNKGLYAQAEGEFQPRKQSRKPRPASGNLDPGGASGTLGQYLPPTHLSHILPEDDSIMWRQPTPQEPLLPPPTQTPSESPSLSPQPPQPPPTGAPLGAATSSAILMPIQQEQSLTGQVAPAQRPVPGLPLQQWPPSNAGGALVPTGVEAASSGRQHSTAAQPIGALQPHVSRAPLPTAGALVAQPSDGLSQGLQLSQGSLVAAGLPPGAPVNQPDPSGDGAPSREEFLQYGVDHGGDRTLLAQGLSSCRDTSVKSNAYKVLLRAGPKGLKVAQILDAACDLRLVEEGWASNRASRASQISNAMRNTPLFVHVGDHKYAIATFPGVQLVPLKSAPGKNSGEKTAVAEGTGRKAEEAATTTARQDGDGSSLARSSSVLESHNSDMASMLAASSNPSMAPILPLPAQLSLFTGPPILTAALNQAIGHGHLQQPSLPSDHEGVSSHMQSMQSLLHGDEPALQPGPT
ncbi:hypothetical protein ABBQ38_001230 [Trebouxia sp. C0009 RCD-2024]